MLRVRKRHHPDKSGSGGSGSSGRSGGSGRGSGSGRLSASQLRRMYNSAIDSMAQLLVKRSHPSKLEYVASATFGSGYEYDEYEYGDYGYGTPPTPAVPGAIR